MDLSVLPTLAGEAAMANAAASGKKIDCAKIVFGDGNGQEITPREDMTALVNQMAEVDVKSVTLDQNTKNQFTIRATLPSNVGGFFMREIGLVDSEGTLLAVGRMGGGYKPTIADNSLEDIAIRMKVAFEKPEAITIVVDPYVAQVTQNDLTEMQDYLEEKIENIILYECEDSDIYGLVGDDSLMLPDNLDYMTDEDIDKLFPNVIRGD